MRRRYTRDLAGVDVAVWGIPLDAAVSNRPGARFGPQAIRRASAIFDGDPQYPFARDPFAELTVIDYGDASFDYGRHAEIPGCIAAQAAEILAAGVHLVSLGGDHFVTWPLLQAHAARHGPLALVQFDAHQDTWGDDGDRLDHGSFVGRAVRAGLIDPARSIQVGIRTHAPEDCGLEIIDGYAVHELGVRGVIDRVLARRRRRPGLPHGRHRLPRPGLRPGHRHAGRRRPELGAGADAGARARRRSTGAAWTWSRWRRPTTMPTSPRSRRRPSCSTISGCWRRDRAAEAVSSTADAGARLRWRQTPSHRSWRCVDG